MDFPEKKRPHDPQEKRPSGILRTCDGNRGAADFRDPLGDHIEADRKLVPLKADARPLNDRRVLLVGHHTMVLLEPKARTSADSDGFHFAANQFGKPFAELPPVLLGKKGRHAIAQIVPARVANDVVVGFEQDRRGPKLGGAVQLERYLELVDPILD